ncbi:MAG TPA: acyltransferase [Terriglobia bacterium]|nr:acyltransferase [Terriglobia bacterium]
MPKSALRRVSNRILHLLARFLPGARSVRPFLHRLRGVRIHGSVFIGDDVYLENEYPENVEIGDGAIISVRSTLVAHTRGVGRIVIEKNAFVGANSVIAVTPGRTLTVGEGSVLGVACVVTSDIPPFMFYGGDKAKPIARVTTPFTLGTSYESFVRGLAPVARKTES